MVDEAANGSGAAYVFVSGTTGPPSPVLSPQCRGSDNFGQACVLMATFVVSANNEDSTDNVTSTPSGTDGLPPEVGAAFLCAGQPGLTRLP